MARTDQRFGGQGGQFRQALPHLRRGALEDTAAPEREQAVAGEQRVPARRVVGDLTDRVARRVVDVEPAVAERLINIYSATQHKRQAIPTVYD